MAIGRLFHVIPTPFPRRHAQSAQFFVPPAPPGGSTADFQLSSTRPAGQERSNHHLRLSGGSG